MLSDSSSLDVKTLRVRFFMVLSVPREHRPDVPLQQKKDSKVTGAASVKVDRKYIKSFLAGHQHWGLKVS